MVLHSEGKPIINGAIADGGINPKLNKEKRVNPVIGLGEITPKLVTFFEFDKFIEKYPDFPLLHNKDVPIVYTESLAFILADVNTLVNRHPYKQRRKIPGKLDHWDFLDQWEAGDCKDFTLTKAKFLLEKGVSSDALHFEAGETGSGWHVWLQVSTDKGDCFLDNTTPTVLLNDIIPCIRRQRMVGGVWTNKQANGDILKSQGLLITATPVRVSDFIVPNFYDRI